MANSTGAARVASFEDFARREYEFELIGPDGDSLIVEMRDVTTEELLAATADMKKPEPPPKKEAFAKDKDGNVIMQLDYDNPAYQQAVALFFQKQIARQILKTWKAEIPGATVDEQVDALIHMPSWAFNGLWKATSLIVSTSEERIKHRSFRPARTVEA